MPEFDLASANPAKPSPFAAAPLAEWLLLAPDERRAVAPAIPPDARGDALRAVAEDAPAAVLAFPAFADGRLFSIARLLRERFGFAREIRAAGPLLPDQARALRRCGVTTVSLSETHARHLAAALGAISVAYQPAADDAAIAAQLRHPARAA